MENRTFVILAADDEEELLEALQLFLEREHMKLIKAADGPTALRLFEKEQPDLVLLDVMMPGMDGFAVLRRIREKSRIPALMMTARTEDYDKILGLELGADDYINKPFRPRELVSRIRSVLRRTGKSQKLLKEGSITVDTVKGIVYRNGEELALSALEYRLLLIFFNNKGVVLSRGRLLLEIWDVAGEFVNDNTLTVYIKRLREKIEEDPSHPELIKTVRGMGYRL